jgi:hypothetical protein
MSATAAIRIDRFGGIRPRLDSRVLGDLEAQVAENCRLWSGKLSSWRTPLNVFPVGHNYLRYSNQFNNAAWTPVRADVVGNATTAPDGSLTADKLRETATTGTHEISQSVAKDAVAEYWTAAISGKPAERNYMWAWMQSGVEFAYALMNLTTGLNFTVSSAGFTNVTSVSVPEANGFFRLHLTALTPASSGLTFFAGISADGTNVSYAGTATNGIYIDGASLRKSNKPGPYRETLDTALPADPSSIYGFFDAYWFVANERRDFARAPLAADTVETTYFTRASGEPRMTYSPIAEDTTNSGDLPRNSFSMGLPVPGTAPTISLSPVTGAITAASGGVVTIAGPIATASYNINGFTVDGSTVVIRANLRVSIATTNAQRAVATFLLTRTGFNQELARFEVPVEFELEPVIGDTVLVERTIEINDIPAAGSHTWVASVSVAVVGAGAVTPTYSHTGATARYKKTLITSNGHNRVIGDLLSISSVTGMEAINSAETQVLSIVNANQFFIDADNLGQIYTSGGTWTLLADPETASDVAYVYTWLATIGGKVLEGPPSAASNIITRGDGQTIQVANIDTAAPVDGGSYIFSGKRIYRTNVRSDLGANYQLVGEIVVGQNNFTDTVRDVALGEVLPSTDWLKPPTTMRGLIDYTNGVMAGFSGKEVCFSEPFQPHAWPVKYRLSSFYDIVALVAVGASVAVLTRGKPSVINGTTPGAMEMIRMEASQPCLSAAAAVDMGRVAIYPGDDGLVAISTAGAELITRDVYTREEWQALNPSTMRAARFDDRYVCSYTKDDGTTGSFILDPQDALGTFTTLDFGFSALWTNPKNGDLYVLHDEYIAQWDAGETWFDYRWRSKTYELGGQTNFSVLKVEASDYPVTVDIYSNPDPERIEEADGASALELVDTIQVDSASPIPLAGDFSGSLYEIEVRGNGEGEVKSVKLATSLESLRG